MTRKVFTGVVHREDEGVGKFHQLFKGRLVINVV